MSSKFIKIGASILLSTTIAVSAVYWRYSVVRLLTDYAEVWDDISREWVNNVNNAVVGATGGGPFCVSLSHPNELMNNLKLYGMPKSYIVNNSLQFLSGIEGLYVYVGNSSVCGYRGVDNPWEFSCVDAYKNWAILHKYYMSRWDKWCF